MLHRLRRGPCAWVFWVRCSVSLRWPDLCWAACSRQRSRGGELLFVDPSRRGDANVTSSWGFYLNLPIGALVLVFLFFAVENTPPVLGELAFKEKLSRIDIPGTLVFIPCIVCLLLALQWGGQQYEWSNGRIIALLALFGVLLITFIVIQLIRQESAT